MPPNAPYRRILVATDFSDPAGRALRQAVELARASGGEIRLIHASPKLEPAVPWSRTNRSVVAGLRREAATAARDALDELADDVDGVKISTRFVEGVPHEKILDEVKRWRADLVVLSARGHSLSERLLLGSTVERVLRKSTIPVLVVPAPPRRKPR